MIYKLYFNITVQKKKKWAPGSHSFLGMCLYLALWLEDSWLPPSAFEASLLLSCLESLSLFKKNWTQLLIWLSAPLTRLILASLQSWVRNPSSCSSSLPLPQCQRQPSPWSCITDGEFREKDLQLTSLVDKGTKIFAFTTTILWRILCFPKQFSHSLLYLLFTVNGVNYINVILALQMRKPSSKSWTNLLPGHTLDHITQIF